MRGWCHEVITYNTMNNILLLKSIQMFLNNKGLATAEEEINIKTLSTC